MEYKYSKIILILHTGKSKGNVDGLTLPTKKKSWKIDTRFESACNIFMFLY